MGANLRHRLYFSASADVGATSKPSLRDAEGLGGNRVSRRDAGASITGNAGLGARAGLAR